MFTEDKYYSSHKNGAISGGRIVGVTPGLEMICAVGIKILSFSTRQGKKKKRLYQVYNSFIKYKVKHKYEGIVIIIEKP